MPVFVRASSRAKAYYRKSSMRTLRNAFGTDKRLASVRKASTRKGYNGRAMRFNEKALKDNFTTTIKGRRRMNAGMRRGKGFGPKISATSY